MALITADWQVQVGDDSDPNALVMGPGTDYTITEMDGFGIPTVRNGDNPRPSDRGAYFGRDFIGQRMPTLKVTVGGSSPADAFDNLEALMAAWQLDTPDGTAYMPLKFQVPGRTPRRFHGRPRDVAEDQSAAQGSQISLVMLFATADPSIFDDTLSQVTVGLANVGTGRTYPLTFPRVYGAGSSGGIIEAANIGNFSTRPVATIVGPCVNPIVTNFATGEVMQCNITLASTDTLVIDFDARTIELNGQSRYSTKTSTSTWWELAPGTTEVHFTANAFTAGATCALAWRSAWMQ